MSKFRRLPNSQLNWRDPAVFWQSLRHRAYFLSEDVFEVMALPLTADTSKSLIILIHPGDVCNDGHGADNAELAAQEKMDSFKDQMELAAEIFAYADSEHVVLHNSSSAYISSNPITIRQDTLTPEFGQAIDYIHRQGAVLYGDGYSQSGRLAEIHSGCYPEAIHPGLWRLGGL